MKTIILFDNYLFDVKILKQKKNENSDQFKIIYNRKKRKEKKKIFRIKRNNKVVNQIIENKNLSNMI